MGTSTGFLCLCYTAHSYSGEGMRRDQESMNVGHDLDTGMQAGTITALTMQQHQSTRVSILLDGAFACGVSQELVRQWGLWIERRLRVEDQRHRRDTEQLLAAPTTALQ